jgi:Cytochrome P450
MRIKIYFFKRWNKLINIKISIKRSALSIHIELVYKTPVYKELCCMVSTCYIYSLEYFSVGHTTLSAKEVAAQAFMFFAAGFETAATTISFCLYELALNPDIQDRLRNEIDTVLKKHGGSVTYEGIQEMSYLDKTISGNVFETIQVNT